MPSGREGDGEDPTETMDPADEDDMAEDAPTSDPIDVSGPATGNPDE